MAGGKRVKVLSAKKRIDDEQKALFDTNATSSRLLALPPEVRNRIWRLLLTGETIHITTSEHIETGWWPWKRYREPKHRFRATFCEEGTDHLQLAAELKANLTHSCRKPYADRHAKCLKTRTHTSQCLRLSLGVLRTCRQIHQEAALLPFADNTFAFSSQTSMLDFVRHILLHQSRAIASMALVIDPSSFHLLLLHDLLKSKFQGLREFACFIELPKMTSFERERIRSNFMTFQSVPLSDVSIAVYYVDKVVEHWLVGQPRRGRYTYGWALREWEEMTVAMLLS